MSATLTPTHLLPMAEMRPVFHPDLMPHQVTAIRRAVREQKYLIAHEQGTGKTITGIMLAVSALEAGAKQVLVVCPPSLTWNWTQEFRKWAPDVTTTIIKGRAPLDHPAFTDTKGKHHPEVLATLPDAQVIIATDGALHGYNRWFIGGLQKFTWDDENAMDDFGNRIVPDYFMRHFGRGVDALIVDECQRVSSGRAGRGRAFTHLCAERPAMPKWLLSGTPFTKTRVGLYNLLRGLDRFDAHTIDGRPADAKGWLDHFCPVVAGRFGSRAQANCEQLHAEMFDAVTGWADRVLTADVITDLPNMGRIIRDGEMRGEWAKKYKRAEEDLEAWLIETRGSVKAERMMKAEALTRVNELRRLVGKAKVEAVIDHIALTLESAEEGEHEPVLVLANHSDIRTAIINHFTKAKYRVGTIHGGMTAEAKQAVVNAWQERQYDIVVANVISASVGFTMTEGRHIVFAELPWNSMDIVQSEARLLRKGQTRDVCSQVVLGTYSNGNRTIDDRLWGLLEGKFREAKVVLDGETVDTMVGDTEESIAMAILRSYADDLGLSLD